MAHDHTWRTRRKGMQRSKTYRAAEKTFDADKLYSPLRR